MRHEGTHETSSRLKSTPPTGAPKETATPAAHAADSSSRLFASLRSNFGKNREVMFPTHEAACHKLLYQRTEWDPCRGDHHRPTDMDEWPFLRWSRVTFTKHQLGKSSILEFALTGRQPHLAQTQTGPDGEAQTDGFCEPEGVHCQSQKPSLDRFPLHVPSQLLTASTRQDTHE